MAFNISKTLIVNKAEQAKLLFYAKLASGVTNLVEAGDDFGAAYANLSTSPDTQTGEGTSYAPITPSEANLGTEIAKADLLRILGFGDFTAADTIKVVGEKGILPVKQVATVTFTVNSPEAGEEINLEVKLNDAGFRGEFATHLSDYKRVKRFAVLLSASDTATTVAAKIKAQIDSEIESGVYYPLSASAAAEVLTLTSTDARVTFTAKLSSDSAESVSVAFAVTTPGYEGRNVYSQLIGIRSEAAVYPYMEAAKQDQFPIDGAKYSKYVFTKRVSRPDLAGLAGGLNSVPTGDFELVLYVNESLTSYITDLTAWINANVAVRTMFTATSASAAIAGESGTTVTSVDSSAPYTNPIV